MNPARKALYDLYLQALGNDFANEHETRGWFVIVDDALDELEAKETDLRLRMPHPQEGEPK